MWNRLEPNRPDSYPTPGEIVQVITESGDERELVWQSNLWWLPDMSMYVYFTPTHWKRMGA